MCPPAAWPRRARRRRRTPGSRRRRRSVRDGSKRRLERGRGLFRRRAAAVAGFGVGVAVGTVVRSRRRSRRSAPPFGGVVRGGAGGLCSFRRRSHSRTGRFLELWAVIGLWSDVLKPSTVTYDNTSV